MSEIPENLLVKIAALRRYYIEHLPGPVAELRRMQILLSKNKLPMPEVQQLYRLSHNFVGSGATFGFPEITVIARDLNNQTNDFLVGKISDENQQSLILRCVNDLIQALSAIENSPTQNFPVQPAVTLGDDKENIVIVLKQSANGFIADLARQLRHFGYNVELYERPPETAPMRPHVVIVDVNADTDVSGAMETWSQFSAAHQSSLLIVSPLDNFSSRLAAVKIGAQGYFTPPVDALKIIDRIEQLHPAPQAQAEWNILIVDDEAMLAQFYSHTLRAEKMSVTVCSQPHEVLDMLLSQSFDLVLIDYLMPGCTGQELARIIRQQERYLSLPIIFMSSDEHIETRFIDQDLGIDAFLVKPFTPGQLVSVVKSRARRAAELRALMTHDSFTGLLNHAAFNERLSLETAVYARTKADAAYVMIDIDHFKNINDTYGHATGDKVIKSLARLMQQQLRRTDIIGRCGGEEFGIIMPGCSLHDAGRIIEDLRQKFSDLEFKTGDGKIIHSTFSGGVSPFKTGENVDNIINLTDELLYEAKKRGRNNIALPTA